MNGRVVEVDQKTAEQRWARRSMRGGYRSGPPNNGGVLCRGDGGGRRNQYKRGNKAATEAVTAEEAKEEGPTDRLKERKRKTHPQQLFLRFPLVCPLTREVVANAN